MRCLTFEASAPRNGARTVRRARFAARSSLPVSAACVVANGARETLGTLLGSPVALRLLEPVIPTPQAWTAILHGAYLYRVGGGVCDAAIVIRRGDAVALTGALFGETRTNEDASRSLSPIECEVLDRLVNAIAGNLSAVCGQRESHATQRVVQASGFVTYFELLVDEPVAARLGVALSRDPSPEARAALELKHLADVRVSVRASFDLEPVEAAPDRRRRAPSRASDGGAMRARVGPLRRRGRPVRVLCGRGRRRNLTPPWLQSRMPPATAKTSVS